MGSNAAGVGHFQRYLLHQRSRTLKKNRHRRRLLTNNSLKRIRQIYMSVSSSFFCSILFVTNKFLHHKYDNDNDGFGDDDRYDDANKAFFLLLIILFVY
jgi:hypothetical protein